MIDGAPTLDVLLISAEAGQQLLDRYVAQPGPVAPTDAPRLDESIPYGTSGSEPSRCPRVRTNCYSITARPPGDRPR